MLNVLMSYISLCWKSELDLPDFLHYLKIQFHNSSLEIEQCKCEPTPTVSAPKNVLSLLNFDPSGQSWGGKLHGQPTARPSDRPECCLQRGQWHGGTQRHRATGFRYVDNKFSVFHVLQSFYCKFIIVIV